MPRRSDPVFPKEIPRARAVAALRLANLVLDLEDDLRQLEQPGDLNEGMEDGTTTVERDVWLEWIELAQKAVGLRCAKCHKPDPHGDYYGGWCTACSEKAPKSHDVGIINHRKRGKR